MNHGAIDVLFHPTSRSHSDSCPNRPLPEETLERVGIKRVLVSQCKQWSCERQWMCVDTRLEDVLRYTRFSPRYLGLAGYNPHEIAESLREIEFAVGALHFRGVYAHLAGFGLPLTEARMYPLFAKAAELGVAVLLQLGAREHVNARRELGRLAADFPELPLVLAQPRPDAAELAAVAAECENAYFALDPAALRHLASQPAPCASPWFAERCMWGSNGLDWSEALRACDSLLPAAPPLPVLQRPGGDFSLIKENFLRHNAARAFRLDAAAASRTPRSLSAEVLAAER